MTSFFDRLFRRNRPILTTPLPDLPIQGEGPIETAVPELHLDTPQLDVGVAQSVGIQRDQNEDALFALSTTFVSGEKNLHFGLFLVADGMGGHQNGEVASRLAVQKFSSYVIANLFLPLISKNDNTLGLSIQEIMQNGVNEAHQAIRKEALGSGTTLTAALILEDQMTVTHVGDSRAYLINPAGSVQLLTHDHSLVKRLEEIGQITAEQASIHPNRNVLYRALGQGEPVEADIATYPIQNGSNILLCTDGLWGQVSDSDITNTLNAKTPPQRACQSLVNLANAAGGPDNISVILVHIPE